MRGEHIGEEVRTSTREQYIQDAFFQSLSHNLIISQSAENYIRTLFNLKDSRISGWGVDAVDSNMTPKAYYEIKSGKSSVKIRSTQFYYQYKNPDSRFYIIMVRREDKLKRYRISKKTRHKVLNTFNAEESLLFNFGDIFIIPLAIIKEHYLLQKTRSLIEQDKKDRVRRYNRITPRNNNIVAREDAKSMLEKTIEKQKNGEGISHSEREVASLTFTQASQIVNGVGEYFGLLNHVNDFKGIYRRNFKTARGPYIDLEKRSYSNISFNDVDDIVIDHLLGKLKEPVDGKDRIGLVNEIKRQRLKLYKEIKEFKGFDEDPTLIERLDTLSRWRYYQEDLFNSLHNNGGDLPF